VCASPSHVLTQMSPSRHICLSLSRHICHPPAILAPFVVVSPGCHSSPPAAPRTAHHSARHGGAPRATAAAFRARAHPPPIPRCQRHRCGSHVGFVGYRLVVARWLPKFCTRLAISRYQFLQLHRLLSVTIVPQCRPPSFPISLPRFQQSYICLCVSRFQQSYICLCVPRFQKSYICLCDL